MNRHYKVAPEPLSEDARRIITGGKDEMIRNATETLRKCVLCGYESADAIQVGGHEPGSQAPLALYHCLHIPSCQMRQKVMALVSEYADCRDDMHLPYVVREIIEIARGTK